MRYQLIHIVFLTLTIIFVSCSKSADDDTPVVPATKAALDVSIENSGEVESQEEIKTIRFIVFDNISSDPKLDVNEYIELSTPGLATDIIVNTLEVTANRDIMVVVIANEPQKDTYSLKATLDAIANPSELENIVYDIAEILNSNGQEILESTGMPMVGVIRDISVGPEQTENIHMIIERAVARVDVFVEAVIGGPAVGYTAGSSSVSVYNISYDSYFVMGNKDNGTRDNVDPMKNYGKVMRNMPAVNLNTLTYTAETTERWSYQPGGENRIRFCSFYMGERIFHSDYSDRLAISMTNFNKASLLTGLPKSDIGTISNGGNAQVFEEIRRNNVYQVTAKIGKAGINLQVSVEDWGAAQDIDIDMPL